MQTLSYGYKQPENNDRGSVWFPALNSNITQLNGHAHNGTDSALIGAANIQQGAVTILAASWTADGTGRYKQTVTCPSGFDMDDYSITVRIQSSHIIHPSIDRVNSTSFIIYTPDNTLTYVATFR
jgi:hypothetical protein